MEKQTTKRKSALNKHNMLVKSICVVNLHHTAGRATTCSSFCQLPHKVDRTYV